MSLAEGFVGGRLSSRGPMLRLGGGASLTSSNVDRTAGSASFSYAGGFLDVCPWTFTLTASLALDPCARLELGALHGEGSRIVPAKAESILWLAASVPLRLRLALGRHIFVELEGAARVPLRRHDFAFFAGESLVYRTPAFSWSGAFAVGAMFP